MPTSRLARLGAFAFRRRRLVLGAWVGALVASFALALTFGGTFSADYNTPGSDSKAAADALESRFPATSPDTIDVVWRTADGTPSAFLKQAAALEGVGPAGEPQVSPDGVLAVARLPLTMLPDEVPRETGTELLALGEDAGVELGGGVIQQAQQGPISSEMIGLAVAFLVLLIALGTVVAAGLPLLLALFGLGIASALILLLAAVLPTPDWSSTVAAMLGIGVGIDYALLILTRYRASGGGEAAIREAVATAGRSVLIAGLTVVISLLGLFAMGLTYLYGVALAAIIAVLVVLAGAITLLPALLGFAGPRIERLRLPGRRSSRASGAFAGRWTAPCRSGRGPPRSPASSSCLALASPVTEPAPRLPGRRQRPRGDDHAAGLRPRLPPLWVRARTGRWWSSRRRLRRTASRRRCSASRASHRLRRPRSTRRATRRSSSPTRRPRPSPPRPRTCWRGCATAGSAAMCVIGGRTAQAVDQA